MEKINNAVFYNIGGENAPEYNGGISVFDKGNNGNKMGGGGEYNKYVIPFSLAANRIVKENEYDDDDEDNEVGGDSMSGGSNMEIPVISGGMFDKLFNMVGHEINDKGKRKTQKKR